jgi:hypothetical protein
MRSGVSHFGCGSFLPGLGCVGGLRFGLCHAGCFRLLPGFGVGVCLRLGELHFMALILGLLLPLLQLLRCLRTPGLLGCARLFPGGLLGKDFCLRVGLYLGGCSRCGRLHHCQPDRRLGHLSRLGYGGLNAGIFDIVNLCRAILGRTIRRITGRDRRGPHRISGLAA